MSINRRSTLWRIDVAGLKSRSAAPSSHLFSLCESELSETHPFVMRRGGLSAALEALVGTVPLPCFLWFHWYVGGPYGSPPCEQQNPEQSQNGIHRFHPLLSALKWKDLSFPSWTNQHAWVPFGHS